MPKVSMNITGGTMPRVSMNTAEVKDKKKPINEENAMNNETKIIDEAMNGTTGTTEEVDNEFLPDEAKEEAALLAKRQKSFKTRVVPKVKVILGKYAEIENLTSFKGAIHDGAVTQEDIDKIEEALQAAHDKAKASLEFLRDYKKPASTASAGKEEIDFTL